MKSFFDHNTGHLTITHMLHVAGIFTNICPKNHPNVVKYTIHGAFGLLVIYIVYILYIYIHHGFPTHHQLNPKFWSPNFVLQS